MKKTTPIILFLFLLLLTPSIDIVGQSIQIKDASGFKDEIKCVTEEKINPESKEDPIKIKTCIWHAFKFVTTGVPDYKGRYGYEYELFLIENSQPKQITNSELFNDHRKELEELINRKIRIDFDNNAKDPNVKDCFEGVTFTPFQLNDMGISFNDKNEMEFNVTFGLGDACMSVDGTVITFSMQDLKKYLK